MAHKHEQHEHHILPMSTYLKVFAALIACTILTVAVSARVTGHSLGAGSALIAMAIATFKAILVLSIFMHLKYEGKMNRVLIGTGFFFLIVFYFFSALDVFTRIVQKSPL